MSDNIEPLNLIIKLKNEVREIKKKLFEEKEENLILRNKINDISREKSQDIRVKYLDIIAIVTVIQLILTIVSIIISLSITSRF
ncbi:MAG: hypothetical protein ACTSRG_22895 [Candidatus Helarchaeota archaeon]